MSSEQSTPKPSLELQIAHEAGMLGSELSGALGALETIIHLLTEELEIIEALPDGLAATYGTQLRTALKDYICARGEMLQAAAIFNASDSSSSPN